MIEPDPPSEDPVATFAAERPRLVGLAYRVTGSRTDAEDVVQDAWLRWSAADRSAIVSPAAWLTTVTSRLALDRLRAAHRTREAYVGPWLPEVVAGDPEPEARAELAESLTIGFLSVLERLGPVERVVFILADVFAVPFDEIAEVVGRSPEACRQVASRARRRVHEGRPRYAPTDDEAWAVTGAFLTAAQVGDLDGLVALLAPDAVLVSDGGAHRHAARRPIAAAKIPRFFANLAARLPADAAVEGLLVNGQPSVLIRLGGVVDQTVTFAVSGGRIERIWIVRNPDKLAALEVDAGTGLPT